MKVMMSLPDEAGCGHYRVLYPGVAASTTCEVEVEFKKSLPMNLDDRGQVVDLPRPDCDVFVVSRPLRRLNVQAIPVMQLKGIAVVVDIDDDFSCVDPRHQGWPRYQPPSEKVNGNANSNREWLARACAVADLVTCTTPALARRYGSHGRVAVLPNYVPGSMLEAKPPMPRDGRTVGWPGFVQTHPNDLPQTRGGVAMACREFGARFMNIGTGEKVADQLELGDVEFVAEGGRPFEQYPQAIAQLDVGVVPLDDTAFNRAKSALKGLELAAVGVPFAASPTADYKRIAGDGVGLLAESKSKKWKAAVLELLHNRDEHSAAMQAAVRESHTLEPNAWRWPEAWEQALVNSRKLQRQLLAVRN